MPHDRPRGGERGVLVDLLLELTSLSLYSLLFVLAFPVSFVQCICIFLGSLASDESRYLTCRCRASIVVI